MGHKWGICESHLDCTVGQWVSGSSRSTGVTHFQPWYMLYLATCLILPSIYNLSKIDEISVITQ